MLEFIQAFVKKIVVKCRRMIKIEVAMKTPYISPAIYGTQTFTPTLHAPAHFARV